MMRWKTLVFEPWNLLTLFYKKILKSLSFKGKFNYDRRWLEEGFKADRVFSKGFASLAKRLKVRLDLVFEAEGSGWKTGKQEGKWRVQAEAGPVLFPSEPPFRTREGMARIPEGGLSQAL
jgi:hypothetical protein